MKRFIAVLATLLAAILTVGAQPDFIVIDVGTVEVGSLTTTTTARAYSGYIKQIGLAFSATNSYVLTNITVSAVAHNSATGKDLLTVTGVEADTEYPVRQGTVTYDGTAIDDTAACFPLIQQKLRVVAGNSSVSNVTLKVYVVTDRGE